MSRPRNTRHDIIPIPATHGVHLPGAIEEQEAEGAAAMQRGDCTVIPARGYRDEDLTALGFTLGDVTPGDDLFREAAMPTDWKRAGTGHSMHTDIVDELGRKRIGIFYKAAWYDRKADLSIVSVSGYIRSCLYEEAEPILDDAWATRDAVLAALADIEKAERDNVELWSEHAEDYAREYEQEARDRLAKIEAMRTSLEAS